MSIDLLRGGFPVFGLLRVVVADVEIEVAFSASEAEASDSSFFNDEPLRIHIGLGMERVVEDNAKVSSLFGLVRPVGSGGVESVVESSGSVVGGMRLKKTHKPI